ncbi:hypothetical protein GCM10011344_38410 [Dokdonia pacifica]|uniref:Lipoprotein n=1 Tax=Dokdonia pacifica TaxID=1627892 RepID=A0A238ZZY4_9FLAO|nr:hypothetical protein [Dokdonia pacifica]GGG33927.1 hypothetical protein GCM10011344_38410 [Dokdonia pacifica]SNR88203.1 hypothetical protein SAMN06265376_10417 [Dokdonia pacifica]
MNGIVTKVLFLIALINLIIGCKNQTNEILFSDNLICNTFNKNKIDHRLNIIPTPDEFKLGKEPYRLNKRPDSLSPLLVYLLDETFEPNSFFSFKDNYDSLNKIYKKRMPVSGQFLKSNCRDFNFKNITNSKVQELKNDRIKYRSFFRDPSSVIIKLSDLYTNEKRNQGVIFMTTTYAFKDNTFGSLIFLEKKGNVWQLKK